MLMLVCVLYGSSCYCNVVANEKFTSINRSIPNIPVSMLDLPVFESRNGMRDRNGLCTNALEKKEEIHSYRVKEE